MACNDNLIAYINVAKSKTLGGCSLGVRALAASVFKLNGECVIALTWAMCLSLDANQAIHLKVAIREVRVGQYTYCSPATGEHCTMLLTQVTDPLTNWCPGTF